jgi:hypothetical protein
MHYFHQSSTFGFIIGLIGIMIALGYTFEHYLFDGHVIHFENPIKTQGTFAFIGVAILTFEGIMTVLPIRDSMHDMKVFTKYRLL